MSALDMLLASYLYNIIFFFTECKLFYFKIDYNLYININLKIGFVLFFNKTVLISNLVRYVLRFNITVLISSKVILNFNKKSIKKNINR